jgi:hypothetical protein
VITLLVGIAVGYLVEESVATEIGGQASNASAATSNFGGSGLGQLHPSRWELTGMVGPLLQQLQTRPNNADLLVNIGDSYYDGQEYAKAIEGMTTERSSNTSDSGACSHCVRMKAFDCKSISREILIVRVQDHEELLSAKNLATRNIHRMRCPICVITVAAWLRRRNVLLFTELPA